MVLTQKEKQEMRKMIRDNLRLGESSDYAKGYQQALKDCRPLTAQEIIRRQYKGAKNFMTPYKMKMGKINPNVAFELSTGSGLSGNDLFGVTLVAVNPKTLKTQSLHDKSEAFGNKNEAEAYINKLKRVMAKNKRRGK